MKYDVKQIAEMLGQRAEDVCRWLLPMGKRNGPEWKAGSTSGESGNSLSVHLSGEKAGLWKDFASGEKGGDLIDLIMAAKGYDKAGAVAAAKEYLGIKDDMPNFTTKSKTYKLPPKPKCSTPKATVVEYFAKRGISEATLKAYKVGEMQHSQHGPVIVFPYFHGETLKFIKYRPCEKKEAMWTSAESEPILFGWQVVTPDAEAIVICEGEIDAMTFYQQGYQALSVPRGAGTGDQQDAWIASEWDRIAMYKSIYLAMDNDDAGKKALAQIVQRLGAHRCFVLDFGQHKDANDVHKTGESLKDILDTAQTMDPPELKPATDYIDELIEYFENGESTSGFALPWEKTVERVRIRDGEISVWAGINGHGKSQVLGHITVNSMNQGNSWCVASMEFKPKKFLARLSRQICAKNIPTRSEIAGPLTDFFHSMLYIFDVQGTARAERIIDVFTYAFRRYGCTNFIVDSLAKCGMAEDDYNAQKKFVDQLMEFAHHNNVHVHLVVHARKGKTESDVPDKMDIKGTGAIVDMVDNAYIVWRNKPKEEKIRKGESRDALATEPDALVHCCKQRNGEWEGKIALWFDPESLQFLEASNVSPIRYCR